MLEQKIFWRQKIADALNAILIAEHIESAIQIDSIVAELPPKPEMGDLGFPMFPFSKMLKKGPPQIAAMLKEFLSAEETKEADEILTLGPYLNIKLNRGAITKTAAENVLKNTAQALGSSILNGKRYMVEFSSPNTNKPLHLGHLRNDVLGESISRILSACGAEVQKVCIINDRGIHICKSMLAYMEKFAGKTPESAGIKSDHFVGDCYVEFDRMTKNDEASGNKDASLAAAQELLRKWEAGDEEVTKLWRTMNEWTVSGIKETYLRTGVSFDKYYFESETYLRGKEEVQKGLDKKIFYTEADGSVWADLSEDNLDKKALLRSDGTSLYITQDFGTAILRHEDWPFDRLVYVVGNEQRYHFQVLFKLLERLGFEWARNLYHLSYGMVNLPHGRMKSREGTVVDADNLIDDLKAMALKEIKTKERDGELNDEDETAEQIALGALHYYLLQISPDKDMLFDPSESLSFTGNTGPYLQYMGARISSMLRNEKAKALQNILPDFSLLTHDSEWELVKTISLWRESLNDAAEKMSPAIITAYLYEMSKKFSSFYHDCPVLNVEDKNLAAARLYLCRSVLAVLKNALNLVCIPFLEVM
ncbi:MAG: arginine--tRNA ligase [Termitinemataceae bacterium]|nr:MAG: arginine--tRNA ligase [Termitinemataceae bacterium]